MPAGFVLVADEADIGEGEVAGAFATGHPVVLCRVRGKIYACSSECTFDDGGDLSKGELDAYRLKCPDHGCEFDIRSGRIISGPADEQLPTYEVRIEGGHVWVSHRPRGF